MFNKSIIFSSLLLLASLSTAFSQSGIIQGKVTDAVSSYILSNANIRILSLQRGTMTDIKGRFYLKDVPVGTQILRISFMGYKIEKIEVEVTAGETSQLDVALKPEVLKTKGVIITSTRYEKELTNVSLPVSVVSQRRIQDTAPVTIADVMEAEPGLSVGRDGVWGTRLVVRGMSKHNVVTLVDGNRLDTSPEIAAGLSMIDLNDIERIEVIRGAGSSLYGTGAIGGVINVVTRNGYYADRFYLSGGLRGSYGTVNDLGMGHLRLTAGGQKWHFNLSSMLRNAGNLTTPDGELPNSRFRDNNVSAKLGLQLLKNQELKINFQQFKAEDVGIPGSSLFPTNAEVRYPSEKREMLSAELVSRNWSSRLRQTTVKYFVQNIQREVENIPNIVMQVPGTPPKRVSVLKVAPGANHDVNGVQFQSDWLLGRRHYFIAGIDYWKKKYAGYRAKFQKIEMLNAADNSVIKTIEKEIGELPLPNSSYESTGIYAQDEIRLLSERFIITLGGRYDRIRTENEEALNPLYEITDGVRNDSPANQTVLWEAQKDRNKSWSGNISLLYQLHPNLQLTLTGAKSFRAPSLDERYQFIDLGSIVKIGDPALAPEKGTFIDFGLNFQWKKLAFSSNFFWNELADLVVEEPATYGDRPALQKVNVGQARLTGFDGRINWSLIPTLSTYGTIAYVRGEDTENDTSLPQMPPLNGRLGLQWQSPFYVKLNLSANMYATQDQLAEGELRTPGYTVLDTYLTTKPFPVARMVTRFVFGVENIFNHSYRNHLSTNRGLIAAEPGRNFVARWFMEF